MSIIYDALRKAGRADMERPPLSVSEPQGKTPFPIKFSIKGSPLLTTLVLSIVAGGVVWGLLEVRSHRSGVGTVSEPRQKSIVVSTPAVVDDSLAATIRAAPTPEAIKEKEFSQLHEEALRAYSAGDLQLAQGKFAELVRLDSKNAVVHNNYGLVLRHLGRMSEAEVEYQRAMALRPSYAEAMNNLGLLLQDVGRTDEAGVWFSKAVSTDAAYAIGHLNYGLYLERYGSIGEAKKEYRKFLESASSEQSELSAKVRARLARLEARED